MERRTGIILNRRNVGTNDRRFSILSAGGKYEVIARGAQKAESKLAGSLEPLTLVEVTVVRGRRGEIVTGSSIRDAYRHIHGYVGTIAAAGVLASTAEALVRGELDDPVPYKRLREAFALLGRSRTNKDILLATGYGLWSLVTALGYKPNIAPRAKTSTARLIGVVVRGDVSLVRRIRCSVGTARAAVDAGLRYAARIAEREIPAAAFFRSIFDRRTPGLGSGSA